MTIRALGGAPLEGRELARFLYVDEAGIGNPKHEPFVVVAGVLAHGDTQLNRLYSEIEAVGRLMPEKCREEGLVLHTSDIYGGNGRCDEKRFPEWEGKRMPILQALAAIPEKANVQITSAALARADFGYEGVRLPGAGKNKSDITGNQAVAMHTLVYLACLVEADIWLRNNCKNENCMVIAEDNNESRSAIRYLHRYHQSKDITAGDPELASYFPLRRIREDPAFQEKRPDHPLILADFVAFVLKRTLMKDPKISPLLAPWGSRVLARSVKKGVVLPE